MSALFTPFVAGLVAGLFVGIVVGFIVGWDVCKKHLRGE